MNLKRYILVLVLIFGSFSFMHGQHLLRRAQLAYEGANYKYSAYAYQRYYNKYENVDPSVILSLANNYYQLQDYSSARNYYEQVKAKKFSSLECFYYGNVFMAYQMYDKSVETYELALTKRPDADLKKRIIAAIASAQWAIDNHLWYNYPNMELTPTSIPINGQSLGVYADVDKVIFSSVDIAAFRIRDDGRGKAITDLAYSLKDTSGFDAVYDYSDNLASKSYVGAIEISKDAQRIYYTKEVKFRKGKCLKIFTAEWDAESEDWVRELELPFCDNSYDCAHPALSLDGKILYFSSNMKGSKGEMDIFQSQVKGNSWGTPKNMGFTINTVGNEIFPNVSPQGLVSFSSDGHPGFGGLDVFWIIEKDGSSSIFNAGAPLNSSWDDFANEMDPVDTLLSYVSTNRTYEGKYDEIRTVKFPTTYFDDLVLMKDLDADQLAKIRLDRTSIVTDIAEVTDESDVVLPAFDDMIANSVVIPESIKIDVVKTHVVDLILSEAVANSSYSIHRKSNGELLMSGNTDEFGFIEIDMDQLQVEDAEMIELAFIDESADFTKYSLLLRSSKLRLYTMESPIVVTPLLEKRDKIEDVVVATETTMRGATFAYGDKHLSEVGQDYLDSWVDFMKKNPGTSIKLMTHTDTRGSVKVNFNLSQQRAFEAKRYLISHGISHTRIIARGYGERYPLVDCQDCSESDHAANRRIEIEVFVKKN